MKFHMKFQINFFHFHLWNPMCILLCSISMQRSHSPSAQWLPYWPTEHQSLCLPSLSGIPPSYCTPSFCFLFSPSNSYLRTFTRGSLLGVSFLLSRTSKLFSPYLFSHAFNAIYDYKQVRICSVPLHRRMQAYEVRVHFSSVYLSILGV